MVVEIVQFIYTWLCTCFSFVLSDFPVEFGEQDETYPMSISVIVCIVLLKALIHTMYTLQQALILVYIFRSIRVYLLHTYGQLQGAHSNYVSAAITYCTYDVLRIILFCDDTRVINRPILGRSGGGGGGGEGDGMRKIAQDMYPISPW